ncbi:hypothetical protein J2X06_003629 [Lysobacter niastensis]|uniref:Uncharacterized protein n=1 Tax=Lysobacter niastensis TaxID=380629 RepID=A0ABU1WGD9_9GAMM|nr:hypothetical protein [Lysobacter niastensis]MDR7136390.1 hypothetical protein [Lysobacter niastensis]
MAFFNELPVKPLAVALRLYWPPFALMALEPIAALLLGAVIDLPGIRAATAIPALLFSLWPAAFKDAPVTFWLLACVSWFIANLAVLAFFGGVVGA